MNIKKSCSLLLLSFFVFGSVFSFSRQACAKPTLLGATGLVIIPTASQIGQGNFSIAFMRPNLSDLNHKNSEAEPVKVFTYGVQYGITKDIEFGAIQSKVGDVAAKTIISAKYALSHENEKSPGISIGTIYEPAETISAFDDLKKTDGSRTSVYAVASHTLQFPESFAKKYTLRGHIGLGTRRIDGFFAGLDVKYSKAVKFSAEYDSSAYNYGVDVFLSPAIVLSGFTQKDRFGFGLSVNVLPKK